jgi:hypothetical protein
LAFGWNIDLKKGYLIVSGTQWNILRWQGAKSSWLWEVKICELLF